MGPNQGPQAGYARLGSRSSRRGQAALIDAGHRASAVVEVLTSDPADIPDLARRVHDAEWMSAPDLVNYEVLNVLRKMVGRGDIDAELAESSRLALRDLRLTRYPLTDEMSDRIWQLRYNLSSYDASYVALAEHLGMPLITTERRLTEAVPTSATVDIESYVQALLSE